jgi:hypothetical protein
MKKNLIIIIVMLSLVLAGCGGKANPVKDSTINQAETANEFETADESTTAGESETSVESTTEEDETTIMENTDEDVAEESDVTEDIVEEAPVVDMSTTATSEDFDVEVIQYALIDYEFPELSKYAGYVIITAKEGVEDSCLVVTLEGTNDGETSYINEDVIGSIGNGSTYYVGFSLREPYEELKCTIDPVEKATTPSVTQNISHEEVIVDGGAEVTITNNGDVPTTPVNCTTLFYKGETVVDMDNGFSAFDNLDDGRQGLAPHTSKTIKEKSEKEFDRIRVFIRCDLLE